MSFHPDDTLNSTSMNTFNSSSYSDLTPSLQTPPIPYSQNSSLYSTINDNTTTSQLILKTKNHQNHTFNELYEKWNNELRHYPPLKPIQPKSNISYPLPYLPNTHLKSLLNTNHRPRDFIGWEAHDSRRYNAPSSSFGMQNLLPEYEEKENINLNEDENEIKNKNRLLLSKVKELKEKLKEKDKGNANNKENRVKPKSSQISRMSRTKLNNSIPKVFINNSTQINPDDFLTSFHSSMSSENSSNEEKEVNKPNFTTVSTSNSSENSYVEDLNENNENDEMSLELANHIINCEDQTHNHSKLEILKAINKVSQMKYHYLYNELINQKNKREKNRKQLLELISIQKYINYYNLIRSNRNSLYKYNKTLLTQLINQRYKKEVILCFKMNKDRNNLINYLINKFRKKEIRNIFCNWSRYCKNLNLISKLLKSLIFHYKCRVELLYMNKWIEYLNNLTVYTSNTTSTTNTSNTTSTTNTSNTSNTTSTSNTSNTSNISKLDFPNHSKTTVKSNQNTQNESNNVKPLLESPEDIYPIINNNKLINEISPIVSDNNNILISPPFTSSSSDNNKSSLLSTPETIYPLSSSSSSSTTTTSNNNNTFRKSPLTVYDPVLLKYNNNKTKTLLSRTSSLSSIVSILNDPNNKWYNNIQQQDKANSSSFSISSLSYSPYPIIPQQSKQLEQSEQSEQSKQSEQSLNVIDTSILSPINNNSPSSSSQSLDKSIQHQKEEEAKQKLQKEKEEKEMLLQQQQQLQELLLQQQKEQLKLQEQLIKQQQYQNEKEEREKQKREKEQKEQQQLMKQQRQKEEEEKLKHQLHHHQQYEEEEETDSIETSSLSLQSSDTNISSIINQLNNNNNTQLNIRAGINISNITDNNQISKTNDDISKEIINSIPSKLTVNSKEKEKEKEESISNNNISNIIKPQTSSSQSSDSNNNNTTIRPIFERLNNNNNNFIYKPLDWNEYKRNSKNKIIIESTTPSLSLSSPLLSSSTTTTTSLVLLSDSVDLINSSISTSLSLLQSNQSDNYYPIPSNSNLSFDDNNKSVDITYPFPSNTTNTVSTSSTVNTPNTVNTVNTVNTPPNVNKELVKPNFIISQFSSSSSSLSSSSLPPPQTLTSHSSDSLQNMYLQSPDGSYPIIYNSIRNIQSSDTSDTSSLSQSNKSIQTSLKQESNKSIQTSSILPNISNTKSTNNNVDITRSYKLPKKNNNKRSTSLPPKQLKYNSRKSSTTSPTTSTTSIPSTKSIISNKSIKPTSKPNDDFVIIKPINREEIEKNIQERINEEIKMKNDIEKAEKHYKFQLIKNYYSIWYINHLYDKEKVAIAEIKMGDYILMKYRKIKQKVINEWKKYYIHKKTLKCSSKYYINILMQKYIRFWYYYKEEKSQKRQFYEICENAIRMRHNQLLLHKIFIIWNSNVIYNQKTKVVEKYSDKNIIRKCFTNWRDYTDMKYRFHLYYNNIKIQIENRHKYYQIKEIFKIWRMWCMKKIFCQTRIKLFDEKKKKKALNNLYLYCKRKQSLRFLFYSINPIYIKYVKTIIFKKWRRYSKGKINSKILKNKIIKRHLENIMKKWFNWTLTKQKYRIYYERITNKIQYNHNKRQLQSSFIKWFDIYLENKKKQISIEYYEKKLLNKMFNKLREYTIYKIDIKIGVKYFNNKIIKNSLLYLYKYSQIHRNNRMYLKDKEIKLTNLHYYYQLYSIFHIWKIKYQLRKKQMEIVTERYLLKLYNKIFFQWKNITIELVENDNYNNELAVKYYNSHYIHSIIDYWHSYSYNKRINEDNNRRSINLYNLNMKIKYLKYWNEITIKMKELRSKYKQMCKLLRPNILKESYNQWIKKYKSHLQLKKVFGYIEKIAVQRYQAQINLYSDEFQLIKTIFGSWKRVIVKRKVKKILLSKRFRAEYSYNNQLILKTFNQWNFNVKRQITVRKYQNKWNLIHLKVIFNSWRDKNKNTKKLISDFLQYWQYKYIIEKHFHLWKNKILIMKIYTNSILTNYFNKWKENNNDYNNKKQQAIKLNNYYITSRYFQLWNENMNNNKILNYQSHKAYIYYKLKIVKKYYNIWKTQNYIEIIKRDSYLYQTKKLKELCYTKWKIYHLQKKRQKENYIKADIYALDNLSRRNCYPLLRSKIISYIKYWKQYACRKRVIKYKLELLDLSTDSLSSCS